MKSLLAAVCCLWVAGASQAATVTYNLSATVDRVNSSNSGIVVGQVITGSVVFRTDTSVVNSISSGVVYGGTYYGNTTATLESFSIDGLALNVDALNSTVEASNDAFYTIRSGYSFYNRFRDGWVISAKDESDNRLAYLGVYSDLPNNRDVVSSRELESDFRFESTNRRFLNITTGSEMFYSTVESFSLAPVAATTPVPLPAGAILLLSGLGGIGFLRRRYNNET